MGLVWMHMTANDSKNYNSWWLQRPFFFQTQDGRLYNVISAQGTSRHVTKKTQKEWCAPTERITAAPWWRILTLASTFSLLAQASWTAKLPGIPAKQKWKIIQGCPVMPLAVTLIFAWSLTLKVSWYFPTKKLVPKTSRTMTGHWGRF